MITVAVDGEDHRAVPVHPCLLRCIGGKVAVALYRHQGQEGVFLCQDAGVVGVVAQMNQGVGPFLPDGCQHGRLLPVRIG